MKMLELNTDNKIMFVVERMKANLLLPLFEPTVSTLLNELNLIKLKLPSEAEFQGITEGNKKFYNIK